MPAATIATRASEQDPSRLEIGTIAGTEVTIADAGGYFVGGNAETVLQEVGAALAAAGGEIVDLQTAAADAQLTGAGMGAATETAHAATPSLAAATIGTARREITWVGTLYADSNNAPDTWRTRWYLDGTGGTLVLDTGPWVLLAGERIDFEITASIRTVGAGGTFDCLARAARYGGGGGTVEYEQITNGGAIDTTGAVPLTVSGWSSSANAAQQMTLRKSRALVLEA